jgi:Tfp pilus assembly protein PilZ
MPVANMKSNEDEVRPFAAGSDVGETQLVIRNSREFAALYQQNLPSGGVFYPTRKKLPVGRIVTLKVRLGRRQPPLLLYGKVAWRRPGRHLEKIRAGVGVELLPSEHAKSDYLLGLARSGEAVKSRRRHERVPVDLVVSWRPLGATEGMRGRLRDVGRGGAFVQSMEQVHGDDQVVVEIAPPGAEVPMAFTARVAWTGKFGDDTGFGIEWRARDAGGGRRIRELVRRITNRHGAAAEQAAR